MPLNDGKTPLYYMQNILLSSSPEWCYQLQQLQQENGSSRYHIVNIELYI